MKLTQLQAQTLVNTYKVIEDEFTTEGLDLVFTNPDDATFLVNVMLSDIKKWGVYWRVLHVEYHNPLRVLISEAHQSGASTRTINSMRVKAHEAGIAIWS